MEGVNCFSSQSTIKPYFVRKRNPDTKSVESSIVFARRDLGLP